MASLIFLLFLITMIFTLMNREKLSFITFGIAMALCVFWFHHHATSTLVIQL